MERRVTCVNLLYVEVENGSGDELRTPCVPGLIEWPALMNHALSLRGLPLRSLRSGSAVGRVSSAEKPRHPYQSRRPDELQRRANGIDGGEQALPGAGLTWRCGFAVTHPAQSEADADRNQQRRGRCRVVSQLVSQRRADCVHFRGKEPLALADA